MEKEIIGYKLKEEFKKYEPVAAKLFNCNKLYEPVGYSGDIEKLKNAKLLDLWFEPIYKEEEYKVGDWCYIIYSEDSRLSTGKVYKINQINQIDMHKFQNYHFDLNFENSKYNSCWLSKLSFRKATKSEIEKALLAEAKKRYPIGTKFYPAHLTNNPGYCIVTNTNFEYTHNLYEDIIYAMTDEGNDCDPNPKSKYGNTYFNRNVWTSTEGWAKIKAVPAVPDITINDYKAEFFDDYVKFGCAEINKEVFIDLVEAKDYSHTNRQIESVTIGKGTFTKEQIKAIVEYYNFKS